MKKIVGELRGAGRYEEKRGRQHISGGFWHLSGALVGFFVLVVP